MFEDVSNNQVAMTVYDMPPKVSEVGPTAVPCACEARAMFEYWMS